MVFLFRLRTAAEIGLALLAATLCFDALKAQEASHAIDFSRDIRPVLAKHCYACHGPDQSEGGLRLSERDSAIAENDSGLRALVPGKPEMSELLRRVRSTDEGDQMPPEGKRLSAREIDLLEQWIADGAEYTVHWSFKPISRPSVPVIEKDEWSKTAIDKFILDKLRKSQLQPASPADPRALIRRLYLNVLGVPPTPSEVEAFASDPSEQAYENLVDQLLADPRMGERWARHWLDVVRYAETNSFERDGPKPNAWKYRDYVIRAFNSDKPYDRFILEQLAGDEIESPSIESLTATAYYRLGIWDDEPVDAEQALFDGYDDIVSTTGQAFMGLTINCARCHDHKIDPISQKDYYQLVAFVRDVGSYGVRGDQRSSNQIDITPPDLIQQYDRLTQEIQQLEKEMVEIEQRGIVKMSAEDQRATEGEGRAKVLREKLKQSLEQEDWTSYQSVRQKLKETRKSMETLPEREALLGVAKCFPNPPETHVLLRGSPQAAGDAVAPDFPKLFGSPSPKIEPVGEGAKSAGRRKQLAQWLTSDQNWTTARVIVNRLWQHHFGRGIVRSPNNFGQLGDSPTHPELLDWLATELIRENWNLKPIHRKMLLSSLYRMGSTTDRLEPSQLEYAQRRDPRNDLFWRYNARRMSAEEVRDSVLAVTGVLNLEKHGPSIYPDVADEVKAGQSVPGSGWHQSSEAHKAKRSVYIHIKLSLIPPELANFDFPETDGSCEARFLTTQPAQALGMLNGKFMQDQARALANRLRRECGDSERARVDLATRLAWGRPSTSEDLDTAKSLMDTLKSKHAVSDEDAWMFYSLACLNANAFLYVD